MLWCRNCKSLIDETDVGFVSNTFNEDPGYTECKKCGSDDLTEGCTCDVCGEGMEYENIHICPECIVALEVKFNQFKEHLEDAELDYLEENLL